MNDARIINLIRRSCKDILWCVTIATTNAEDLQHELFGVFENEEEVTKEHVPACRMGDEVWSVAEETVEARLAAREDAKWERNERKLTNRGCYLPVINMQATVRETGEGAGTVRWGFKDDLDSSGLMVRALEYHGFKLTEPVVMNVENKLPFMKDERGRDQGQYPIPQSEIDNFWANGYLYSGGKTIWNVGDSNVGKQVRAWFELMLPTDIDFGSYNRRFRAPLVPGGFIPNISVRTHSLHAAGTYQGADGSGVYDPAHPLMAPLVSQYGAVGKQFTAFCPTTGKMWKGMLYPREGINDGLPAEEQVAIHFDHLQVKGRFKAQHKEYSSFGATLGIPWAIMDHGVHIGIMKAKTSMGKVQGCFELGEQIGPAGPYTNVDDYLSDMRTCSELFGQLVDESMERIAELGPEGLLGRATRDDPKLRRLAEFLVAANSQLPADARINPLDIPMIKAKLDESLSKTLWGPTNGGGIRGKYPVVCCDNTVDPGSVVIRGHSVGRSLAVWRFPTILAQSLLTLKVAKPLAHQTVQGEIIPNVIFMNPQDIVVKQQGDDDGDEVGVSDDQRLVKLFHMKQNSRVYHIEPESEKRMRFNDAGEKELIPAFSKEGREYISKDPTGPVGAVTIMKAGLDAVGASDMATAFAVGCQEAIDSQKNYVRPTDPYKAAKLENWYCDKNGEYHIHYKIDGEYVTDNFLCEEAGDFPLDVYEEAYEKTLIQHGCMRVFTNDDGSTTVKPGWPLGWRTQYRLGPETEDGERTRTRLRKAVAFTNWEEAKQKQDGDSTNWVHFAHDRARAKWLELEGMWTSDNTLPAKDLLPRILAGAGMPMSPQHMSWEEYSTGLREVSGLNWYGKEFKKINARRKNEGSNEDTHQGRLAQIDILRDSLDIRLAALSAQDLLNIWWMELGSTYWYFDNVRKTRVYIDCRTKAPKGTKVFQANTPNYAFTAVANSNSAIMELLGFELKPKCSYLVDRVEDLADRVVNWCFKNDDVYARLTKLVRADKAHAAHKTDGNGEPVFLGDCPDCMSTLRTTLIRRVRSTKQAKEIKGAMALNSAMNRAKQDLLLDWDSEAQVEARAVHRVERPRDPADTQENAM